MAQAILAILANHDVANSYAACYPPAPDSDSSSSDTPTKQSRCPNSKPSTSISGTNTVSGGTPEYELFLTGRYI